MEDNEEVLKASENLKDDISLGINIIPADYSDAVDTDLFLIPYDLERKININDILYYQNSNLGWSHIDNSLEIINFDYLASHTL